MHIASRDTLHTVRGVPLIIIAARVQLLCILSEPRELDLLRTALHVGAVVTVHHPQVPNSNLLGRPVSHFKPLVCAHICARTHALLTHRHTRRHMRTACTHAHADTLPEITPQSCPRKVDQIPLEKNGGGAWQSSAKNMSTPGNNFSSSKHHAPNKKIFKILKFYSLQPWIINGVHRKFFGGCKEYRNRSPSP